MQSTTLQYLTILLLLAVFPSLLSSDESKSEDQKDFKASVISVIPVQRPVTKEKFITKTVNFDCDGISGARLAMEHSSILMENGIPDEWQLMPDGTANTSIAFANRTFQTSVFSISLFRKGHYLNDTTPKSLKSVAAALLKKHGAEISFESWQDGNFNDPSTPSTLVLFNAKAIGYRITDQNHNEMIHRLYFFEFGNWLFEVAFRSDSDNMEGTFEAFGDYLYNLVIVER